jgi:hypothetical protein
MINFKSINFSCIILEPNLEDLNHPDKRSVLEKATSILYSKDYEIFELLKTKSGLVLECVCGISKSNDKNLLRDEAIFLMDTFFAESVIVKYFGEQNFTKIKKDGSELILEFSNEVSEITENYFSDGFIFHFLQKNRYSFPKNKQSLKEGMVVEYFDSNCWKEKTIINLDKEYDSFYKLFMKYQKLRVKVSQN